MVMKQTVYGRLDAATMGMMMMMGYTMNNYCAIDAIEGNDK